LPSSEPLGDIKKKRPIGRIVAVIWDRDLHHCELRARATINRRHAEYTEPSSLVDAPLQSGGRNARCLIRMFSSKA
jgi:hypothetical protein